jgi:hypothetical protein
MLQTELLLLLQQRQQQQQQQQQAPRRQQQPHQLTVLQKTYSRYLKLKFSSFVC